VDGSEGRIGSEESALGAGEVAVAGVDGADGVATRGDRGRAEWEGDGATYESLGCAHGFVVDEELNRSCWRGASNGTGDGGGQREGCGADGTELTGGGDRRGGDPGPDGAASSRRCRAGPVGNQHIDIESAETGG